MSTNVKFFWQDWRGFFRRCAIQSVALWVTLIPVWFWVCSFDNPSRITTRQIFIAALLGSFLMFGIEAGLSHMVRGRRHEL